MSLRPFIVRCCAALVVASSTLIAQQPLAQQWKSLFDGSTLEGWTDRGGRYDGDAVWTVEDGAITGRVGANGVGGLLYTTDVFASFDVELQARLDWPFDSGVFVRMWPEGKGGQVTLDAHPRGGEVGAIYADGFLQHNTWARDTVWKRAEWNDVRVRCTGFDMRIEAWVNGVKVSDHTLAPNTAGYAPRGRIGIQVHGNRDDPPGHRAQFRSIRVRRLDVFGDDAFAPHVAGGDQRTQLSVSGRSAGWVALIDDELGEWWSGSAGGELTPPLASGYRVEDGVLHVPSRGSGNLISRRELRNARMRFDFKLARMANGGVFLRSDRAGGNPSYTGAEVQLLDDHNWESVTGSTLEKWQFTGSLYGAVAPEVSVLAPIGEWNTMELLYRGSRLAVALNGHVLYDVDTHTVTAEPPFAERVAHGFFGMQRYSAPDVEGDTAVWVRNAYLQPLP